MYQKFSGIFVKTYLTISFMIHKKKYYQQAYYIPINNLGFQKHKRSKERIFFAPFE